MATDEVIVRRRATDSYTEALTRSVTRFWDWIDKRQIAQHLVSVCILLGTIKITEWAMSFAITSPLPGVERAAVIAAVLTPYSALQAAAIGFFFNSRKPG